MRKKWDLPKGLVLLSSDGHAFTALVYRGGGDSVAPLLRGNSRAGDGSDAVARHEHAFDLRFFEIGERAIVQVRLGDDARILPDFGEIRRAEVLDSPVAESDGEMSVPRASALDCEPPRKWTILKSVPT